LPNKVWVWTFSMSCFSFWTLCSTKVTNERFCISIPPIYFRRVIINLYLTNVENWASS
jgi:hypothetical protein